MMQLLRIGNETPMIRRRILVRFKQGNDQFVVFYFGYLFRFFIERGVCLTLEKKQ